MMDAAGRWPHPSAPLIDNMTGARCFFFLNYSLINRLIRVPAAAVTGILSGFFQDPFGILPDFS